MTEPTQLLVLYRQFLRRTVDLELLSPEGDLSKLLGQFAAVLVLIGSLFAFGIVVGFGNTRQSQSERLISAWGIEHILISTTMLAVGVFAVLSWDSLFPDLRDVMVLGCLPVPPLTLFLAKIAASASMVSLTVVSLNGICGLLLPVALAPNSRTLLDLLLAPERYRLFAAYWITMFGAAGFLFGAVLILQCAAAILLSRRWFLKSSAFLQMGAFALLISTYFLQPSWTTPAALSSPEHRAAAAWLPSYWFLALFQQVNGCDIPVITELANRAWIALGAVVAGVAASYAASYWRMLKKIVEQPDILRQGSWQWRWPVGGALTRAIVDFSARTLLRSRQHRLLLALYLGAGFAVIILFLKTPRAQQLLNSPSGPLIFSNLLILSVWIVGTRVAFTVPMALPANWIFRITAIRPAYEYFSALRCPLFALSVAPVWAASAVLLLLQWPWHTTAQHLALLALWGTILGWIALFGFRKIPFTCSWLPGKSHTHMACLAALGFLFLTAWFAGLEYKALQNGRLYIQVTAVLAIIAAIAWRLTVGRTRSDDELVQFEEAPDSLQTLGL